jgi:hypothetical protein
MALERRLLQRFARAVALTAALPACSSDKVGSSCPTGVDAESEISDYMIDDAQSVQRDDAGTIDCFATCADADPVRARQCCTRPEYLCSSADDAGRVGCTARCSLGGGRLTRGTKLRSDRSWLGSLAQTERASVPAFARLRRELRSLGAPHSLLRACSRARRDEVRHARMMESIARSAGCDVHAPIVGSLDTRDIVAIAIENVAEGCVRETYGALLATWQSRFAREPHFRQAMKRIAREETRHAALAHRIDDWLRARLDSVGRAAVDAARRHALRELRGSLSFEPDTVSANDFGFPSAMQAHALLDSIS